MPDERCSGTLSKKVDVKRYEGDNSVEDYDDIVGEVNIDVYIQRREKRCLIGNVKAVSYKSGTVVLFDLIVDEQYRRCGFGNYAMRSIIDEAKKLKHEKIRALARVDDDEKSDPFNAWRVKWYKKFGLVPIKYVREFKHVLMELKG